VAAGCASAGQAADGPPAAPAASASPAALDPSTACPTGGAGHLRGDGADVTDAWICAPEVRTVPGDGAWQVTVVRRITGGLPALLVAYAAPDDGPRPGAVCTSDLPAPLTVVLRDGAGIEAVRAPVDGCAHPTDAAERAYAGLVTEVAGERRDTMVRSELSVQSGCADAVKDVLALAEGSPPAGGDPAPLPEPVRVCAYAVGTDEGGTRTGSLESSRTLTGAEVAVVDAALTHVTADPTCSLSAQTRIAFLGAPGDDGLGGTVVALDGCAVAQDGAWWRAGDDLRAAVGG
jgi:hypothetical protein